MIRLTIPETSVPTAAPAASHLRHAEPSVDQDPVQDKIDHQRNCGRNEGNLDALCRPHQKADDHRQYLQRISKANDPDIGNRHLYNIFLICINSKQKPGLVTATAPNKRPTSSIKLMESPKVLLIPFSLLAPQYWEKNKSAPPANPK